MAPIYQSHPSCRATDGTTPYRARPRPAAGELVDVQLLEGLI
jgi:hypothetical protein